jgi:hypothetical protein
MRHPKSVLEWVGQEYEVTTSQVTSFVLPDDYDTVRKIFVRTNASADLIEYQQGKLVDKQMGQAQLNVQRIRKPQQWTVYANGRFKVRHTDPELGEVVYTLGQKVAINQDRMTVDCVLDEPTKYLKNYDTSLTLAREGTGTLVTLSIGMRIAWKLPSESFKSVLQNRVDKSGIKSINKLQEGIRVVVDKYREEVKATKLSLRVK